MAAEVAQLCPCAKEKAFTFTRWPIRHGFLLEVNANKPIGENMKYLVLALLLVAACAKPEVETQSEPTMIFKDASPAPTPQIQDESEVNWSAQPKATPAPKKKRFRKPIGS